LLYEQLKKLDFSVSQRQEMANCSTKRLPALTASNPYKPAQGSTMTYWKFCLRVDDTKIADGSVGLAKALKNL